jgi:hypothetical protein
MFLSPVGSPRDAYIILEAARIGILPKVTRRLTDLERIRLVKAGACFVFEERESGIRRWTDQVKHVSMRLYISAQSHLACTRWSRAGSETNYPSDP